MDLPSNDGLNSFLVSKKQKNNFKVIISGAGETNFFLDIQVLKEFQL